LTRPPECDKRGRVLGSAGVVLRGPWDTINVIKVAPTDLAQGSSTTTSTFPAMWARRADSELTTHGLAAATIHWQSVWANRLGKERRWDLSSTTSRQRS